MVARATITHEIHKGIDIRRSTVFLPHLSTVIEPKSAPKIEPNDRKLTIQEPWLDVTGISESLASSFGKDGDGHAK